jgi:YHS domain-containing protein
VPCPDVFVQDVPEFARRMGLELEGYLDASQPAVIDDDHMVRLNYEAFFFSSPEQREVFLGDPVARCGLLTDPVSKRRFLPDRSSPRAEHDGVLYVFETRENLRMFRRRPDDYRLPGWTM